MTDKVFLSADDILALDDRPFEDVHVPEWGTYVRIQGMTGAARDAWETSVYEHKEKTGSVIPPNMRAGLVARCAVNAETGEPLFTSKQITALGNKSGKALDRLFEVAQRINGITEEDIEELEKNSESDQSDDSG